MQRMPALCGKREFEENGSKWLKWKALKAAYWRTETSFEKYSLGRGGYVGGYWSV